MTESPVGTVLYVEDDPDFREAIQAMLEARGFRVLLAETAEEGLAAVQEEMSDVALLDLMLEEVDSGVTLATRIRALRPDLPIFLLTSVGDAMMDTHDWSGLGITGVLQKPVEAETLVTILGNAMTSPA